MAVTLSTRPVTFVKLKEVGDKVAGTFVSLAWDVPSTYGPESSIRLEDEQGNVQQVRLASTLVSLFKDAEDRLVPGKTHLTITLTGEQRSKKDPKKTYNVFDVQAEGELREKGAKAPAAPAPAEADEVPPF
jgi:hypothetical protein